MDENKVNKEQVDSEFFNELNNLLLNMSCGLHPNNFSIDEIELLKKEYGDNWLEKLGYTKEWLRDNPS